MATQLLTSKMHVATRNPVARQPARQGVLARTASPSTEPGSSSISNGNSMGAAPGAKARPSYTVSLWDALKFNGPAPETINGRLAMVGFVNAVMHEVGYGEGILQQIKDLDFATVLALLAWTVASLVPICKGVVNNEPFWIFSPDAEMVNGRVAMLAIVALTVLEYKVGVPFF